MSEHAHPSTRIPAGQRVRTGSRSRAAAFGLMIGGSLLGLLLAGQSWWTVPAGPPVTGNQATDALAGTLSGAALAGAALALLLRTAGRRVLGILGTALGLGMLLTGSFAQPPPIPAGLAGSGEAESSGLWLAYTACGVLLCLGGILLTLRAHTWPSRPDRFARLQQAGAVRAEDDPAAVWKALDQGFDPTGTDPGTDGTSGRNSNDRGE